MANKKRPASVNNKRRERRRKRRKARAPATEPLPGHQRSSSDRALKGIHDANAVGAMLRRERGL